MSTRSLLRIYDENGDLLVTLYRQCDGYPTGMGASLKELIGKPTMRNGFGSPDKIPTHFNGMGCLAAWLIGALKRDHIGNVYVYAPLPHDDTAGAQYIYELHREVDDQTIRLVILSGYDQNWTTIYDGPVCDLDPQAVEAKVR